MPQATGSPVLLPTLRSFILTGGPSVTALYEVNRGCFTRRLLLWLTGVFLLVTLYAFSWFWLILKPRWDDMRPFVGTWRLVSPSPAFPAVPEVIVEMDLKWDGTIIERTWDPQTGAVSFNQPSPARWQISDGRYQEVWDDGDSLDKLLLRWGVGSGSRHLVEDSPVTWEGPDRFRFQRPPPKNLILTWARCESPTDLPRTHIPIGPK